MDMLNVLNIISIPECHCAGFEDSPPLFSGDTGGTCNSPTGCKQKELGYDSHHMCYSSVSTVTYCECFKNNDRAKNRKMLRHYFKTTSKNIAHCICYKCQIECYNGRL
jgi:hypothetical protein